MVDSENSNENGILSFFGSIFCGCARKRAPTSSDIRESARITRGSIKQKTKYLVLDLDQTLIHAKLSETGVTDTKFKFSYSNTEVAIYIRPYLTKFLEEMVRYYTVLIYTASLKEYARKVIKTLEIDKHISQLLHRKHCVILKEGLVTKDLSRLGVPLENVLLIDDTPLNAVLQPENCLLVDRFEGQPDDRVLLDLIPFLKKLAYCSDVRDVSKRYIEYMKKRAITSFDSTTSIVELNSSTLKKRENINLLTDF